MRVLVRLATVAALVGSVLAFPISGSTPSGMANAADLRAFDPGNIISDAVFFDPWTIDAPTVQAFLAARGASCVAGEQPCLKDYRQTTATQPGDAYCSTYTGAPNETASSIIVKVGQACGINPRVLIVLLQKEQGLVTGTRPATVRYTKATGFACPDTAACNPEFSGFASQVYFAARQFQRYAANAAGSYRAGRNNTVLYNPNSACGSSQVFIQNKATAGLYSYTPYQPNAAALAANYGTGDSCSSYGNRNFYNYFTDWFGSTQSVGGAAITDAVASRGGTASALGQVSSSVRCNLVFGGCLQNYTNGTVYWSPSSGAYVVAPGPLQDAWAARGWEASDLGYPVADRRCGLAAGGCLQTFQAGTLYSSSIGAFAVRSGAVGDYWAARGWEAGVLGYPTGEQVTTSTGSRQPFQEGTVYATSSGTAAVLQGPIGTYWAGQRWEQGPLGHPRGDQRCGLSSGGCLQTFDGGTIYSSTPGGTHAVSGAIAEAWGAERWEQGPLGYPTGDLLCTLPAGGCLQAFQGGTYYTSPAGTRSVPNGAISSYWGSTGWERGPLGYPTNQQRCDLRNGGCVQSFEGGSVYSTSATGTHAVSGQVATAWAQQRWEQGALGYPTSEQQCGLSQGGCTQAFQGGSIYSSAAGAQTVPTGPIATRWSELGGPGGFLGYPVAAQRCGLVLGGCLQSFQGGTVYTTPTTGTQAVSDPIADAWAAQRWEQGPWGYPTGPASSSGTLTRQSFQGGAVTYDSTTGSSTLR